MTGAMPSVFDVVGIVQTLGRGGPRLGRSLNREMLPYSRKGMLARPF